MPPSAARRPSPTAAAGEQWGEDRSAEITSRAWITAATGDVAPARTFAAERAIAAVAVIPPKNGATMLPSPANQLAGMLGAGHAIKHHRAQQRFNGAEHRH